MRRAVSVLCLLALVPLGFLFARVIGELPLERSQLVRAKYASWSGVLRIWVSEDWGANATGWLNRAIASFEKRTPGVYIEAKTVDREAARTFAVSGINPPDMLLVSPGVLAGPDRLLELGGLPALKAGLLSSADGYAAPVLMGAYGWAHNRRMLEGLPATFEGVNVAAPAEMGVALVALCSGTTEVYIEPPGLDLGLPVGADAIECRLPEKFAPSKDAYRDFINARAAALPVSQGEVRRLVALSDMGKGPDWAVSASGKAMLADQLLLLAIVDWEREDIGERQALCQAFLAHLLSEEIQRTLSTCGNFPVIETAAIYAGRAGFEQLEIAANLPLLVPNAFDDAWRERAQAAADGFLAGQISAREGLKALETLFFLYTG